MNAANPRSDRQIFNLHQFWDGLIIGSHKFQDVRNEATRLRLRPDRARDKLHGERFVLQPLSNRRRPGRRRQVRTDVT